MNKKVEVSVDWADAMDGLIPYYFVDGIFHELDGKVYPASNAIKTDNDYSWVQVVDGNLVKAFKREEIVWR